MKTPIYTAWDDSQMLEHILKKVTLQEHHLRPGRTKHSIIDAQGSRDFAPFVSLQIVQYDDGPGYYLFHMAGDGAVADTWHLTMEEALEQAESEFEVQPQEWTDLALS